MSTSAQQQLVATAAKGKYGSLGRALADLILAQIGFALAGVNILGMHPLFFLEAWATNLTQDAANALNSASIANAGVAATNSDLAMTGGKPLHEGVDVTADSTIPYTSAINNIHCNINAAAWGFIRIGRTDQKQTVTTIAKQSSGTTTLLRFDVYRLEVDGSVTLLAQTGNVAGALTTSYAWIQSPITGNAKLPVHYDDILAVQCIVDTGVVDIAGLIAQSAVNNISRPYQLGGLRDAAAAQSPSTIPSGTVDAMYTSATPFFQLGSAEAASTAKRTIADDFQGNLNKWIMRHQGVGSDNGDFTISGGRLTYNGSNGGYQSGVYQVPLTTDDFDCGFWTANPNGSYASFLQCACNIGMDTGVMFGVFKSTIVLRQKTSWTHISSNLASASVPDTTGASWTISYRSATKTWSVYRDQGTTPVLTWTEPASGGPLHGTGNRYFGIEFNRLLFAQSGAVDTFWAKDADIA